MSKIISIFFVAALLFANQLAFAKNNVQKSNNEYGYSYNDEYDFDDNSYYINDEKAKDIEDMNNPIQKSSFTTQVVNSGHFSSNTATRTYIPINRK